MHPSAREDTRCSQEKKDEGLWKGKTERDSEVEDEQNSRPRCLASPFIYVSVPLSLDVYESIVFGIRFWFHFSCLEPERE